MEQTRKEYIESELNKWKQQYEIGFEQEFDIKALLELQYQFTITPKDHVKTLGDIIHTKNQIMKNLGLKPTYKKSHNHEIWYVELNRAYENMEENKYANELKIVKMNKSNGQTKVFGNLNKHKYADLNALAQFVLIEVRKEKPNALFIDEMGIGRVLYESLIKLLSTQNEIFLKANGELHYFNK